MAKSMLAAVHDAMRVDADEDSQNGNEPGAAAPETGKETAMDKGQEKPAASETAGVPQADHDAAVATARQEGATEATTRLTTILGAEGIKGDAGRMTAALDLAVKSPAMSAEDVTSFVTANVAQAAKGDEQTSAYEQERVAAAGQAAPQGQAKQESGLSQRISAHIEQSKR
ncbi:hypothetical protein [Oricola indica]|jgi:hypothetical protein|uniref:hypothetical protein n=1 Tax=Oricola indica TaxID=2872591 RepID=UPI001CC13F8E|nr:hypothetical protein [Oricola indica]